MHIIYTYNGLSLLYIYSGRWRYEVANGNFGCKTYSGKTQFVFASRLEKHAFLNTLKYEQKGLHSADDVFKWISVNEPFCILVQMFLESVPNKAPTDSSSAQVLTLRRMGTGHCLGQPRFSSMTHICINSSPPGQNGRHFADDIFRCILTNKKFCILSKFRRGMFRRAQSIIFHIGLDNGLGPNRRQAIIWITVDPIPWRIYALGGGWVNRLYGVKWHLLFH